MMLTDKKADAPVANTAAGQQTGARSRTQALRGMPYAEHWTRCHRRARPGKTPAR